MKKIFFLLIVALSLSPNFLKAQTVDDFNYAGNLTSNGWTSHPSAGSNLMATTTGLSYAGYVNSGIGNAALVNNLGGDDCNYTPGIGPYSTVGSSVYFSFMVKITEAANKTGDYFIHIGNRTSPTSFSSFSARVFTRTTASGVNFGISNTSTAAYGTTNFSTNTTYLIVVKYSIVASGNNPISLWVLPSGIPFSEANAGTPEYSATSTAGQNNINAIALRQGSATTSVQTVVDGIRIGTSWADVMFVPLISAATGVAATSFNANWGSVTGATGYYLDVATDASFTTFVAGFNNKDVGNVTTYSMTGLTAGQIYYYRVRAYNASITGQNSGSANITTVNLVLGSIEGTTLAYTENDPATIITSSTTLTSSAANLAGAVINISANYKSNQDVLSYVTANGISGSWNSTTGILTLSGTSAWANYQTAIQNVMYQNTSESPDVSVRTVSFSVNDGTTSSNTVTRNIAVTSVNDVPALAAIEGAALSYNTGSAMQITNTITLTDLDNSTIPNATVQITGNYSLGQDILVFSDQNGITGTWTAATGILSLTGSSTLANYQAALRSIKFQNASLNASTLLRTVSFTVNDGIINSNTVTRNITVDNTPVIASIESTALTFSAGDPQISITNTITVSDVDNANLAGAVVQINGYYESGKDILSFTNANGISGTWDAINGILTLSGVSSVANYQTALRSVKFQNISDSPAKLIRTISFTVNDGSANSNSVTRNINLGYLALTLGAMETDTYIYKPGDGNKNITNNVTVSSPSWPTISSATIQITKNYYSGEDILSYVNSEQITGSWNAAEGKLELTGTTSALNYQTALRSVTYGNSSSNPNISARTISFVVNDGYNKSNVVSRIITMAVLKNIILTANLPNGGTISGGGSIYTGTLATVTATPNAGYTFVNWTEGGNVVSTNPSYSFTVSTDRSLTANFSNIQFVLTTGSSPAEGGTTSGGGTYNYGTSVTVQATPLNAYTFVNWTSGSDVVSTSPTYTFAITSSQNLVANFVWPSVLAVNQDVFTVGPGAGNATINVSNTGGGTFNWTAVSDIFWLKINSGTSGTNNGTISISYSHNNSIARVGTITIIADGVSGSPKKIEVRQSEIVLGVENIGMGVPTTYKLEQNYPNPFNPSTKIRFGLPRESKVVVMIYNVMGEEIAKLVDGDYGAGFYEVNFDASKLSSGLYMYMISAGDFVQVKKMVLTK